MTREEKSDMVFDIINSGKPLLDGNLPSFILSTPFDFFVSKQENNKTVRFDNMQDAIDILSEFPGIDNLDKLTIQITKDLDNNNISSNYSFILEFKVSE